MNIDTCGRARNIANLSRHFEVRNIPITILKLGISALFLLECKKWAGKLLGAHLST
jgi:hypothetical protein